MTQQNNDPATPANKVLVLTSLPGSIEDLAKAISAIAQVKEISSIDEAVEALRQAPYDAILSDTADFLPLERALVKQQASLILNTLGEGVCIVDQQGHCAWSNRKMQDWPARVHESIRRKCQEAFNLFAEQLVHNPDINSGNRSRRFTINVDDQRFFELVASPVVNPAGQVVQVVAVIWDSTGTRRLQQKIDAIDRAGRELMRMEANAIVQMHISERLKILEEKVVNSARDLLHFDHFIIRALDPKTKKLELVISVGVPEEAKSIELFASAENNGISGLVAATGKSYMCPDVENDPRYVIGLDHAKSSLTVPLFMFDDKVVGIFNIESRHKAAFTEDDRQIAEIFGHYIAMALHMFNLLITENVAVRRNIADDLNSELAEPMNDICTELKILKEDLISDENTSNRIQDIINNVQLVRNTMRATAEGKNIILGAGKINSDSGASIAGARVLVADDNDMMRDSIASILKKYGILTTLASHGMEAIDRINATDFDLVISDIRMPHRNGYQVFQAAKAKNANIPVILTTAFGHDAEHCIINASKDGLEAVLYKPFHAQKLLDQVVKTLSKRSKPV